MTLKIAVFTRSGAMRGLRFRKTRFAPTRPPESGRIRATLTRKGEPYGESQLKRFDLTAQSFNEHLTRAMIVATTAADNARVKAHSALQAIRLSGASQPLPKLKAPPRGVDVPWIPSEQHFVNINGFRATAGAGRRFGVRRAGVSSAEAQAQTITAGTQTFTGLTPYWTYQSAPVPGVGSYAVNIGGQQNLVFTARDLYIPNKGIALRFDRFYNSQSQHDYAGTDGSQISNYGGGWTNTFDAHVAFNSGNQYGQGITVYDETGARFDYLPTSSTASNSFYSPPPGMGGTSVSVDSDYVVQYLRGGVANAFFNPNIGTAVPKGPGEAGRLAKIFGRNTNNYLSFAYTFDTSPSTPQDLNTLVVTTEAGQAATLSFSNVTLSSGGTQRLLTSLTRPDGVVITYAYDPSGDLQEIPSPVNSTSGTTCAGSVSSCLLSVNYYLGSAAHSLTNVVGPRDILNDYAYNVTDFPYSSSNNTSVASILSYGVANPTLSDNYSSGPLQPAPAPTGAGTYRTVTFSAGSGATTVSDSDLHQTIYDSNPNGSGTIVATATTVSSSLALNQYFGYDQNLDLNYSIDPNNNETDHLYDPVGYLVATGLPSVSNSDGTYRPVYSVSRDAYGNPLATCDPEFNHANGVVFTSGEISGNAPSASDSICPSSLGATRYSFTDTSTEGEGELTSSIDPLGTTTTYGYSVSAESASGGTDFGLPTSAQQPQITQADGTSRTPSVSLTYDNYGDVATITRGASNTTSYTYFPNINLLQLQKDADGVYGTSYEYYPNLQVSYTQNASESQAGVLSGYAYDGDGNTRSISTWASCSALAKCSAASATTYWYDGDDRMVEVQLPLDTRYDVYKFPWMLRYYYDLSEGGDVSIGNNSIEAYGGLYKTQQYLPSSLSVASGGVQTVTSGTWQDTVGTAYDAMNRGVASYDLGMSPYAPEIRFTYDSSGKLGLLSAVENALSQTKTLTYDAAQRIVQVAYTGDSYAPTAPTFSYSFDGDSRTVDATSSFLGALSFGYDADSRLITEVEPSNSYVTVPSTMAVAYYEDGLRQAISITPVAGASASGLNVKNIVQESYRSDGLLQTRKINFAGLATPFAYTYSAAGRPTSQTDPSTGQVYANASGGKPTFPPISATYDAEGRVASMNFGSSQYTAFGYDDEGVNSNYQTYFDNYNVPAAEFESIDTLDGQLGASKIVQVGPTPTPASGLYSGGSSFAYADALQCGGSACVSPDILDSVPTRASSTSTLQYDGAGRLSIVPLSSNQDVNGKETACAGSLQRYYDLDNRLNTANYSISNSSGCTAASGTIAYDWRADGNLGYAQYSSYFTEYNAPILPVTLHWLGNQLLFTSDSSGNLTDLHIDANTDIVGGLNNATPAPFIIGRDWTGTAVTVREKVPGSTWIASDSVNDPYDQGSSGAYPDGIYGSMNFPFHMTASDGIWDNYNVFQSSRSYDTTVNEFTSRDPSPGSAGDPASQSGYTRDRNNALVYSDPTGRDTCDSGGTQVFGAPDGNSANNYAGSYFPDLIPCDPEAEGDGLGFGGFLEGGGPVAAAPKRPITPCVPASSLTVMLSDVTAPAVEGFGPSVGVTLDAGGNASLDVAATLGLGGGPSVTISDEAPADVDVSAITGGFEFLGGERDVSLLGNGVSNSFGAGFEQVYAGLLVSVKAVENKPAIASIFC